MKTINVILQCLESKIKKYFFIKEKGELSQDCKNLFEGDKNTRSAEDVKCAEEYLENYKLTTRWQTL